MAIKKVNIGDIIAIPIKEKRYGMARIINKVEDTCLFEMYIAGPFSYPSDINFDKLMNFRKVYSWCYDDYIKKGKWQVIENVIPSEKIKMPYFTDSSYYSDIEDMRVFLIKGDSTLPAKGIGEKIFITRSEAVEYRRNGIMSIGIAFPDTMEIEFRRQLGFNNLVVSDK